MNKLEPQKLLDGLKKSLKNKRIDYEKIITEFGQVIKLEPPVFRTRTGQRLFFLFLPEF